MAGGPVPIPTLFLQRARQAPYNEARRIQSFGCTIWETRLNRRRIFSSCHWRNGLKWPSMRLLRRSLNRIYETGVRSLSGAMAKWLRCRPRSCEIRLSSRSDFLPKSNLCHTSTPPSRRRHPGGLQGDGKHSHLKRRHYRELRARRRSPNWKSIT